MEFEYTPEQTQLRKAVREFAELLGENEAVSLLGQTLEEEKETDRKLTELAHAINRQAVSSAAERSRGVGA